MIIHSDPQFAVHQEVKEPSTSERPLMLAYWGRRGALPKLTLDLARIVALQDSIRCSFSLSTSNELFEQFKLLGNDLFPIRAFTKNSNALFTFKPLLELRYRLKERFRHDSTRAFVSLMPHVWSPFVAPVIRRAGVRHIVVVHDADPHPGDHSGLSTRWLLREAAMADRVITLSKFVAHRLVTVRGFSEDKISILFHPDINYCAVTESRKSPINERGPLRVLFFGRILAYKGLGLLVDAVEALLQKGLSLELGVYGRGKIEPQVYQKLSALNAKVVNRWLSHDELTHVFSHYDVVVIAHTEASQSGIIAAAFGAQLPVIAVPVGGLVEQVTPGVTGIITESVTSHAIAGAIAKVAEDRALLTQFREGIIATREERSVERFFRELCRIALS